MTLKSGEALGLRMVLGMGTGGDAGPSSSQKATGVVDLSHTVDLRITPLTPGADYVSAAGVRYDGSGIDAFAGA
jgi:hypothetical protein